MFDDFSQTLALGPLGMIAGHLPPVGFEALRFQRSRTFGRVALARASGFCPLGGGVHRCGDARAAWGQDAD